MTEAVYKYISELEDIVGKMSDVMLQCADYMNSRADADFIDEQYYPNEEMKVLSEIQGILDKEKAIKSPPSCFDQFKN